MKLKIEVYADGHLMGDMTTEQYLTTQDAIGALQAMKSDKKDMVIGNDKVAYIIPTDKITGIKISSIV